MIKKLTQLFLSLLLIGALQRSEATNSATLVDNIPGYLGTQQVRILVYDVAIDTINTNVTIETPAANIRAFVVGMTTGATGILTSGTSYSQTVAILERPAKNNILFNTAPGQALKFQSSATGSVLFYVIEGVSWRFPGS